METVVSRREFVWFFLTKRKFKKANSLCILGVLYYKNIWIYVKNLLTYAYYERIVHRTFPAIMLRTVNSSLVVRSCAGLQIGLICLIVGLLILKTFITSTGLFRGKIQTGMDVLRVNRLFNLFHCNVASHRNQSFKKKKKKIKRILKRVLKHGRSWYSWVLFHAISGIVFKFRF